MRSSSVFTVSGADETNKPRQSMDEWARSDLTDLLLGTQGALVIPNNRSSRFLLTSHFRHSVERREYKQKLTTHAHAKKKANQSSEVLTSFSQVQQAFDSLNARRDRSTS